MLEFPHTAVGVAIASVIPNPFLAVPLSLASHFITDYVPHWNPHIHTEKKTHGHITTRTLVLLAVDAGAALIFGSWIAAQALPNTTQAINVLLCSFASVAPDVVEIPYYFTKIKIRFIEKLLSFQRSHQWNVPIVWGLLSQLLVVLLCLKIIF